MDIISAISLNISFIIKCLLAIFLGAIIGLERELKNKPAGLKTHVLICLGATAITFLSDKFAPQGDPGRIAAQIVSGIGFIGAGTILHARQVVQGLTTAATLWLVASIGMLIGAGFILPAISLSFLITIFFLILNALPEIKRERKKYCMSLEIMKLRALDTIDDMVTKFDLDIEHKSLVKGDKIYLDIHYYTVPLTQHIFLKRLFQLKGIGKILKI
jgi:putative Mg2+ transporter-C (MgtC) family protein